MFKNDGVVAFLDCATNKTIFKISMVGKVIDIKFDDNRMFIVLRDQIHVFSMDSPPQQLYHFSTRTNPLGICAVTKHQVAFPQRSPTPGYLQIVDTSQQQSNVAIHTSRSGMTSRVQTGAGKSKSTRSLKVASHEVAIATFNSSATQLATASTHGTLVRVYSVASLDMVHEFRRGSEPATISNLEFNPTSTLLVVSSDKGTFHVFNLAEPSRNQRGMLATAAGALASVPGSMYSYKKFTMPERGPFRCCFLEENILLVLSFSGTAYTSKLMDEEDEKPQVFFSFFNQYMNPDM